MTTDAADLAERLLDAHVAYVVEQLTGPDGAKAVAADFRGLLKALSGVTVNELVDLDAARATVELLLDGVAPSAAVAALLQRVPVLLHDLPADDEHDLEEVVDRRDVADRREHVTITRHGRPSAVLVPVREYEALDEWPAGSFLNSSRRSE